MIRIDKLLCGMGYTSRRHAIAFIRKHEIDHLNGKKRILSLHEKVDPDDVMINGHHLEHPYELNILVNKPPKLECLPSDFDSSVLKLFPQHFTVRTPALNFVNELPLNVGGMLLLSQNRDLITRFASTRIPLKRVYELKLKKLPRSTLRNISAKTSMLPFLELPEAEETIQHRIQVDRTYSPSPYKKEITKPPTFEFVRNHVTGVMDRTTMRITLYDHKPDNILGVISSIVGTHDNGDTDLTYVEYIKTVQLGELALHNNPDAEYKRLCQELTENKKGEDYFREITANLRYLEAGKGVQRWKHPRFGGMEQLLEDLGQIPTHFGMAVPEGKWRFLTKDDYDALFAERTAEVEQLKAERVQRELLRKQRDREAEKLFIKSGFKLTKEEIEEFQKLDEELPSATEFAEEGLTKLEGNQYITSKKISGKSLYDDIRKDQEEELAGKSEEEDEEDEEGLGEKKKKKGTGKKKKARTFKSAFFHKIQKGKKGKGKKKGPSKNLLKGM